MSYDEVTHWSFGNLKVRKTRDHPEKAFVSIDFTTYERTYVDSLNPQADIYSASIEHISTHSYHLQSIHGAHVVEF